MPVKYLALITLLISPMLFAQNLHMAVLGGGGEPKKNTTIFDQPLEAVGKFSKSDPSIKTSLAFNGGHAVTEGIAQREFGVTRPFTLQTYNAVIDDYVRKMNSGEIKSGDKILMYVHTHGATKSNVESTHGIATSGKTVTNFNDFSGPSVVSMDSLKRIVDVATSKGIKLGIVDLSCHSGNSLALANANTCVISGTGPHHYAGAGSSSFGTIFSQELKKGRSLEEVFLASRKNFTDTSFPMISSPAGRDVQDRLYNALTPYLYYYHPDGDKFTPFMEKIASQDQCELDSGLTELMREAEQVLKTNKDAATKISVLNFEEAIKNYYVFLTNLRNQMRSVGFSELNQSHRFCSGGECVNYTVKQMMTMNYESMINFFSRQASASSGADRKSNLSSLDNIRQAQAKYAQILAANPGLKEARNFWGNLRTLTSETSILQSAVARTQKELYRELYQNSNSEGPNPCKDFVL